MNRQMVWMRAGVGGRSEAGVEDVATGRAGNRHGNVISNNIPESL
ncbi:hypothetical protein [[Clostridium] hylemonae]|nr:hypothetical protein [[Clostridium] hylemonae]